MNARAKAAFRLHLWSLGLVIGAGFPSANGQDDVTVLLPDHTFYIGQQEAVSILTSALTEPISISVPETDGIRVALLDHHPVDGAGSEGHLFRFSLLPLRPGEHTFPAMTVRAGNGAFFTPPTALVVEEPALDERIRIATRLSTNTCYIGQAIEMEFSLELDLRIEAITAVDIRLPMMEDPAVRLLNSHKNPSPGSPDSIGLPVHGTRMIAGTAGNRISFRKIIVPQSAGTFQWAPAYMLCSVKSGAPPSPGKGFTYPSYFDNTFFQPIGDKDSTRIFNKADPMRLQVLPLPDAGRPPAFKGIVGAFGLSREISTDELQMGDPVVMTLKVEGHPAPEAVELPALDTMPGYREWFEISDDQIPGIIEGGVKIFRVSLRPLRPGVSDLPELRIPYFDVLQKVYGEAVAPPVPITVRTGSIAGAGDVVLSDGSRLRTIIKPLQDGVTHNFSPKQYRRSRRPRLSPRSAWMAALMIPPFLFLLLNMATRYRQLMLHAPDEARRRWALRRFRAAKRRLAEADVATLQVALQIYVSDRLAMPRRKPGLHDMLQAVQQQDHREALRIVMRDMQACRFCAEPHPLDWDTLLTRVQSVVDGIDREARP